MVIIRTERNIYKRNDGRWEGRYFKEYDINGKSKYTSVYGKSYTEVKEKLKTAKINNTNKQFTTSNNNKKFNYVCYEWLNKIKNSVKTSTYSRYLYIIEKYLFPITASLRLNDIDKYYIDTIVNNNIELSTNTLKSIIMVFKSIIKFANEKYDINITLSNTKLRKQTNNNIKTLSIYEQNQLIRFLMKETDYHKLGIILCLFTGIRIGEICALKWKDIDFQNNEVVINKTVQRIRNTDNKSGFKTSLIIDTPKSVSSSRIIPLPKFIIDLLKKYRTQGYLLTGNEKYIEPRAYQYKFKKYLIEANIEAINFHALRHTFATRAIEKGFDANTLSEILGHSSVKTTLEKYVHTSMEQKRKQMEKLDILQ